LRTSRLLLPLTIAVLAAPSGAGAAVPHTVAPGETLWSIAAANNFTTGSLAAYNGLSADSQVVLGGTIMIPSEGEAAAALGGGAAATPQTAPAAAPGQAAAPPPAGSYTVQPGDTLSGIAASSGVATDQVAWMNGLDPEALLLAGTALKLPTGAPAASAPSPEPTQVPDADPQPTPVRTSAGEIGQIASQHGVDPSLAAAVAWQESGFNNAAVSSANARGVMQVLPGTWDWIQQNLASSPLDPASANDNVRAGVLYLDQLLRDTGGDEATALAAYYQGLGSVQSSGMLPETQQYVNNVMALRGRFGGP
jgi:soluble lytic murein transglycosylase-like protein